MKFKPNRYHTSIAIYAFLVIAALLLFYEAVQNFSTLMGALRSLFRFVQPVVYGFVFAYLLNPLLRLYDDRLLPFLSKDRLGTKTRRIIALLLTYPTIFIIIGLFVAIVVPQLIKSIESINITYYFDWLNKLYSNATTNMKNFQILSQGTESEMLISNIIGRAINTMEDLVAKSYDYLTSLVPMILSVSAKFTTSLINLLLGVIISIYFLFDREKLFAQCKKIISAVFPQRASALLYDIALDTHRVFSGFIIGKIIDSIIIGILCFVGLLFLPTPPQFRVLISVIVGVTNVIPYFGPFIGAIPSVILIFIVDPLQALWFLIFILLLQQFDGNILGPKILGDTTGLSALWVIFAIMLFNGLLGIIGMFMGVPLFAVIYTLVKRFVSFLLRKRDMPTNTEQYASDKNPLIK